MLREIAPLDDEMIFRKTSSNVFVSTNIDYVLRNLGVRSLMVAGLMTDQCVESAVRDAWDTGAAQTCIECLVAKRPMPWIGDPRSNRAVTRKRVDLGPESQCFGKSCPRLFQIAA